jgi:hypothetical protein
VLAREHFLSAYEMTTSAIFQSESDPPVVAERVAFVESNVPQLVTAALGGANWASLVLKVLGSTGTADILGAVVTKVLPSLARALSEDRKNLTVLAARLVTFIRSVAQSADVVFFTISQPTAMRGIFRDFFPWCHQVISILGLKVRPDLTLEITPDNLVKLTPFLISYVICIGAFAQIFKGERDPGRSGALHGSGAPPWVAIDAWAIEDRRKAFECLVGILRCPARVEIPTERPMESLLQSVPIFDAHHKISPESYKLFIELETKNYKI